MKYIDAVRLAVRQLMRGLAAFLNRVSNGRLKPNAVTIIGVVMHLPIAILIASGNYRNFFAAAILLIIFGLFDTLDGELARLQNTASPSGMLLDASTDRMKEVLLYAGVAYYIAGTAQPRWAVLAVLACGASLTVSYVKAKAEAAVAASGMPHHQLNRLFKDGLLTFELRISVLLLGLLFNVLIIAVGVVAVLAGITVIQRLVMIMARLKNAKD